MGVVELPTTGCICIIRAGLVFFMYSLLSHSFRPLIRKALQFDDWFNLDVDDTEAKQRIIGQLHKLLRPFMLRRLKIEVETSLPPKSETILFTGMSTMQKNLYK